MAEPRVKEPKRHFKALAMIAQEAVILLAKGGSKHVRI